MNMRVGLIGCGNISEMYLSNAALFDSYRYVACADLNPAAAEAKAKRYGLRAMSPEELIASDDIDIVLNLTVPAAHAEVSLAALSAGKHIYSEKPLATSLDDAKRVLALAAQKGLRVGCAPDTVLGPGVQTARKMIAGGEIGPVVAGTAFFLSHGLEDWHPDPTFFFKPGGGPVLDMGPYYISALCTLLGPVSRVQATGRIGRSERLVTAEGPMTGKSITVETLTTVNALLSFANGAEITFTSSWDAWNNSMPHIELHGEKGTLRVPDPNYFGGTLEIARSPQAWESISTAGMPYGAPHGWPDYPDIADYRGLGLSDMAEAIRNGTPHRSDGETAMHVLEVLTAILAAAQSGQAVAIESRQERQAILNGARA
ncbi:Gfo/Idh/MocA family oxidoreductase [Sinorhizobium sp. BG8]|uniref:Gfo/Idh/MocA family protein n=1 Tax=Sinorhizobium sp. BG8 TaxID=2613773 RepID=UPI00193E99DB|nr:Gfo/Idh/MocA family oxidoreductase [Sinorhizobium sp. BG8]QRM57877.1 Gfo/Idh/MocA family oxidoreductase [Sinorhizobium sp. BG8]